MYAAWQSENWTSNMPQFTSATTHDPISSTMTTEWMKKKKKKHSCITSNEVTITLP